MEISSNMKVIYNDGEPCHIFDYCWIIENAKELHLVESAFCYLVEKLKHFLICIFSQVITSKRFKMINNLLKNK